jgi:hypothetical protein
MGAVKGSSDRHANAGERGAASQIPGPRAGRPNRALVGVVAAAVLLAAIALGAWLARSALDRPLAASPDSAELVALDDRLTAIQAGIRPIASAFNAEPDTGLIDVGAYRARIATTRRLVDSTNDLTVSGPEALEVRDLIITGGSQVLSAMDAALDALVSDEASATVPALAQIDEGLTALQDARDKLDALLGKKIGT